MTDALFAPVARTRIKFCGMTSPRDVALAVGAGADAVGIILAQSERGVSLERAAEIVAEIPPYVAGVGVIGDDVAPAAALRAMGMTLQFSGPTAPAECAGASGGRRYLKTFHVTPEGRIESGVPQAGPREYAGALWMFDAAAPGRLGGTGIAFQWDVVGGLARERPIVVSGGLTPENVGELVRTLRPYGVDVRSGIERDGQKDPERMRAFVRAVLEADLERARLPTG